MANEKRDKLVGVAVTPSEHEKINRAAELADETVSSWARRVLLDEASEERVSFRARKTERMGYRLAAEIEGVGTDEWMRSVLNERVHRAIEEVDEHLPVPSRDETEEETEQEVEEHEHVEA